MTTPVDTAACLALARAAVERDAQRTFTGYKNPNVGAAAPTIPRPTDTSTWTYVEGEYCGNPDIPALAAAVESLVAENARLRALGDALALEASTVIVAWGEGHTCGMIELSLAYRAWDAATAAATATEGGE